MEKPSTAGDGAGTDVLDRIIAVMTAGGELPAGVIAERAGVAYSTTTPKLRALEGQGRAHRHRVDGGRILWRLTTRPDPTITATAGTQPEPTRVSEPIHADESSTGDSVDEEDNSSAGTEVTDPITDRPAEEAALPDTASPETVTVPDPADTTVDTITKPAHDTAATAPPGGTPRRRGKGVLRDAALAILRAHPDRQYKVGELAKLLDGASGGAVANALIKLAADGVVTQTVEKPATFQAN